MNPIRLTLPREEAEFGPNVIVDRVAHTFPVHTHTFFEISLVVEGKALHHVNGYTQLLERGSLLYLRPNDVHWFSAIDAYDMMELNMGLTDEDFMPVLEYLDIPLTRITQPELPVHLKIAPEPLEYLRDRLTELARMYPSRKCRPFARSFMTQLFYPLISPENAAPFTDVMPQWLTEMDAFMSIPENFIAGVSRLYAHCNYSQEHVIRSFRRYYGITPTEYVNNRRALYAGELMRTGRLTISEICFSSGFNNMSHFYKVFNAYYHCTPRRFLQRLNGNG